MLGARDVLVAEEKHAMAQPKRANLLEQLVVHGGVGEADVPDFGADRAGERLDADRAHTTKIEDPMVRRASSSRCAWLASWSA
jgi:hypothetical protein